MSSDMARHPENLIFTACTGRCGQFSLVEYLNVYGDACLAEAEPPDLIYPNHWPLGNWMRHVQRRWIVTNEDLGRGKALHWYDEDRKQPLLDLARKRVKRISRLCSRVDATTYIEASKFFIRSYCDAIAEVRPDIGLILLRRDPLANARSFCNRGKSFRLDGVMPDFRKACLPMDASSLSQYQLYLWQWAEIELRFQRFVESKRIQRYYVLPTEDLNSPQRLATLFDFFSISTKAPIVKLEPKNTNEGGGRERTKVSQTDLDEFDQFFERLPNEIRSRLPTLANYRESYRKPDMPR
jgi:hypothetical protein